MTSIPPTSATCTLFNASSRFAFGPLRDVALAAAHEIKRGMPGPLMVFDDATGEVIEIDARGSDSDILSRLGLSAEVQGLNPVSGEADSAPRGRGRPKLGVVPREVTLLPRHWDWLGAQPGGASVALRKLVDEARKAQPDIQTKKRLQERAYRFMSTMAGDREGFEEASRALFAGDENRMREKMASWPQDVREHAMNLAFPADAAVSASQLYAMKP